MSGIYDWCGPFFITFFLTFLIRGETSSSSSSEPRPCGQGYMLFNPIITDFVKTIASHLFHVIIIELKRQKQIYSIILPESKKIMSSKITLNRQRHEGAWLNRIQKEVEKVWPPPLSLNANVLALRLYIKFAFPLIQTGIYNALSTGKLSLVYIKRSYAYLCLHYTHSTCSNYM